MKGLLIKDFKLIKMQWKFIAVLVIFTLVMAFFSDNMAFLQEYLIFVMPLLAVSTISYDEFDNGNAFLFSLPISRQLYVAEKYVLALILGTGATILSIFISYPIELIRKLPLFFDTLKSTAVIFPLMAVIIAIMLPLQLKFGSEKGRLAMIAVFGGIVLLGWGARTLLDLMKLDISPILAWLNGLNFGVLVVFFLLVAALLSLISVLISIKIMKKKEF